VKTGTILLAVAVIHMLLGFTVLSTNRQRRQNQQFLFFCLVVSAWSALMTRATQAWSAESADFLIRLTSYVAVFIPISMHLLFLAIESPYESLLSGLRRGRWTILFGQLVGLIAFTPFFMAGVIMPDPSIPDAIPQPVYRPGSYVHSLYFALFLFWIVGHFFRRLKRMEGMRRVEMEFSLLAIGLGVVAASTTNLLIPAISGSPYAQQFGPFGIILVDAVMAYGIATRRIMEVRHVLRAGTAYILLITYLCLVYTAVWFGVRHLLSPFVAQAKDVAHVLAAFSLALSLAPMHGRIQHFSRLLFVGLPTTDVAHTTSRAVELVQSIGTVRTLLDRFHALIVKALDVPEVHIFLREEGDFLQVAPSVDHGTREPREPLRLRKGDPLVVCAENSADMVDVESIERMPPGGRLTPVAWRLAELGFDALASIRGKESLEGIVLLGSRSAGRVYGVLENKALRVALDHLAIALENARLYTEIQNSKIYNEILLDTLVSGVVAINTDGIVTRFNREAQRITGLSAERLTGAPVGVLPAGLARQAEETLKSGVGVRHAELNIAFVAGETIPIELASTVFHGHEGGVLGVMLLFNDLSVVKKLETQVRRTAHLASLGTLSAGMAHEIKNPLVTLKTFAQLLHQRYDDAEFRDTFSDLVGKEVSRIDGIVNQLLEFSRPAKARLSPISASEVLEHSLRLVDAPLKRSRIALSTQWSTEDDTISGDFALLEQAFINFFLNAIDAMKPGGCLKIETRVVSPTSPVTQTWSPLLAQRHLVVSIADTGSGIGPDVISQIFDPFFTTKSTGTGLGLSVAHGIIQEHNGMIDVESAVGKGTTFRIFFPAAGPHATR
jgi:PAS domain S-box-containing protein